MGTVDGREQQVGNNGDVVTILAQDDRGLRIRTKEGAVADIEWRRVMDKNTRRLLLGHGHALTIDAAQGITSDEHINALPRGTAGVTAFTAYVAESRSVGTTWTMISEGALFEAERRRQALGDITPITPEDLWSRAAEDMSEKPYKGLGIDLLAASQRDRETAIRNFIASSHKLDCAQRQGPEMGRGALAQARIAALSLSLGRHLKSLEVAIQENGRLLRDIMLQQEANRHLRGLRADASEAARHLAGTVGPTGPGM